LFSFLADRTNGRAYATVSIYLLSVSWLNIVFLPKKNCISKYEIAYGESNGYLTTSRDLKAQGHANAN